MKTKIYKQILFISFLLFLVACSTKKDSYFSRNVHALSTRDNILYNGQVAFDKGIASIKNNEKDNFWKRLPIEKMQTNEKVVPNEGTKNPDFKKAEEKATKAIQKHSMNIDGRERNYQIDEAYMLLGQARYYDQRFFPALEAFNYILYKYPTSSNIVQAKIWREKTNMRLGNDPQVIKYMNRLLEERILIRQDYSDVQALLAQSFLNMQEIDSSIVKLKIAEKFSRVNSERVRYRFVLGQLYQELGIRDTALFYYQSVIKMNRKVDREYLIQGYAKRAELFDFENGDADAFVKKYNKLVANRENRPFLDIIFYQMGLFYDKRNEQDLAKEFYNASIKENSQDSYLTASDYRNLGNMNFRNTDYSTAAKYYDSTLVKMDSATLEHIKIKKIRKDLTEVIAFEFTAKKNDSILNVVAMSDADREVYFGEFIEKIKKADEEKKLLLEKEKQRQDNLNNFGPSDDLSQGQNQGMASKNNSFTPPSASNSANTFYFYNPATVAFGKVEFRKKLGDRALSGNWRVSTTRSIEVVEEADVTEIDTEKAVVAETPQYATTFYTDQLPKTAEEIDFIAKERNTAYFQLGVIYKEKFKEYELATQKLEALLVQNPEEKLILPTMYNLYKIYQITDSEKAAAMKIQISNQYPDSRYAQIINDTNPDTITDSEASELEYNKWYKLYQDEQFCAVLEGIDAVITQYYGDDMVSKFELLKANCIGKIRGLAAYKVAMQFVADNYPTTEEGHNANEILTNQIPKLEKMAFTNAASNNWRILYQVSNNDEKIAKAIEGNYKKFISKENVIRIATTFDIYTENNDFVVIKGISSEAYARNVAELMAKSKEYKIAEPAIVISNENYKVIQIKKNLADYLNPPIEQPVPEQADPKETPPPPPAALPFNTDDDPLPKKSNPMNPPDFGSQDLDVDDVPKENDNQKPKLTKKP